ncbi:efflux RND transporter periplasmic adaptor subunit [Bryobacter aggregatus]|uniref:efflux RND transporter periplasmic adaptor subunit n=1 Tax=Bryobacter aggregatus TaxID=360054 RepID=UPI0004E19A57|nr:efflux RND transporter periplasmic adaptor subunit [Bryobacter aggregatus]
MDIQREGVGRKKLIRRIGLITVAVVALGATTYALSRLKPAAPTVEGATLWYGSAKRGSMLRQVRGLGTLVPEEILLVPAANEGRVDKRVMLPGTKVSAGTIIIELSNQELMTALDDAKWAVKAAEAEMLDLKARLNREKLEQKSKTAQTQSEQVQAQLQYDRDDKLFKEGLAPNLTLMLSKAKAEELGHRLHVEEERLSGYDDIIAAQVEAKKVNIEKLRAAYDLKKKQVEDLHVRAGVDGVLQDLPVQVGQRVTLGTVLAKVSQPWKLKTELKIPETQMNEIRIGMEAEVDTRNGVIKGQVSRIDPAAVNGTVTVDIRLLGDLPQGARPDLSVDGTIEIEKLTDVLYVERPVIGQANATVGLFRVNPDGKEAERVQVKFGRSSVNTIEVVTGLKLGDKVVLSDMSQWDAHNRVRLN